MKALLIACTACIALTANAASCNKANMESFIAGNYTVIAQEPNSNHTYSATMSIHSSKSKIITLDEKTNNHPIRVWRGQFRAAEPGEGCVLDVESKQYRMACLVSSDLDNFARLTCLTKHKKTKTTQLGLLALFPTQ